MRARAHVAGSDCVAVAAVFNGAGPARCRAVLSSTSCHYCAYRLCALRRSELGTLVYLSSHVPSYVPGRASHEMRNMHGGDSRRHAAVMRSAPKKDSGIGRCCTMCDNTFRLCVDVVSVGRMRVADLYIRPCPILVRIPFNSILLRICMQSEIGRAHV